MWLALDIGNSTLKAGWFQPDGYLVRTRRFAYEPDVVLPSELGVWIKELELDTGALQRLGVASVVPERAEAVRRTLRVNSSRLFLRADHRWPFMSTYQTPETLGIDRLAAACGGWYLYEEQKGHPPDGEALIVIDAGTAVTYEVIDTEHTYRGGAIAPGPVLLTQALHKGTAQLPTIPLRLPPSPIGSNTVEALQSGVLHGFIDGVAGMVARYEQILKTPCRVVVTGGWSSLLHQPLGQPWTDPDLVLRGIYHALRLNEP